MKAVAPMTPAELAEMGKVVEQGLGDLPATMHKFLRAGMPIHPESPYMLAWCEQNKNQVARIIGELATAAARRMG